MKIYVVTHPYFEDICELFLYEEDATLFQEDLEYHGIGDSIKSELDLDELLDIALSGSDDLDDLDDLDDFDSDSDLAFLDDEDILKLFFMDDED